MKKTRLTRLIAGFLSLMMLGSGLSVAAAAETETVEAADDSSMVGYDIADVQDLLNAEIYADYAARNADVKRAESSIVINAVDYNTELTDAAVEVRDGVLYTPSAGTVTWDVDIPETAKYAIKVEYNFLATEESFNGEEAKATAIERRMRIDGAYPFKGARYLSFSKVWQDNLDEESYAAGGRGFKLDLSQNEIRPEKSIVPGWSTYVMSDSTGYDINPFEIVFTEGAHTISFEGTRETLIIKNITLYPYEEPLTYSEVEAQYQKNGYKPATDVEPIIIEAEFTSATSDQTIYPQNDRTSAITSPQSSSQSKLNSIGGTKWQSVGQWIEYTFTPEASGLYEIVPRFKQADLNGMYTSRRIYINGEVPFEEANYLQFNFSESWNVKPLNNGETSFQFYFEAGKEYTIRFEVVLGEMSEIIGRIQNALTSINNDYLKILQITGADPDQYRDYNFRGLIPDTIKDLYKQYREIDAVSKLITEINGAKGSNTATLDNIARVLEKMATDEDEVAKNLSTLKSNIGTLGTWLNSVRSQPLLLDYISIQPAGSKLPKAEAGFFDSVGFEVKSFVMSFFTDYSNMGATKELNQDEIIDVWAQSDRDSAQVIRTLCDNDFVGVQNIGVNLRLVAAGTLLPATLSGTGPDVALENAQTIPVQYAIRSAVLPLNPEGYADKEGDDEAT